MLNTCLVDPKNKRTLHVDEQWEAFSPLKGDEATLVTSTIYQGHGTFRNISRNTAGTETIVQAPSEGSLVVTDCVINTEKRTGGAVTVQFTDGVDTVDLFKGYCQDAPININIAVSGRFQGWQDARVDVVVEGATDCSVTLGYMKIPNGIPYKEWDSYR